MASRPEETFSPGKWRVRAAPVRGPKFEIVELT